MNKPSWQYDALAQQIQCPDHLAAKLVLRHLGSKADDGGKSYHGYDSIAAYCSVARSKVSPALQYLRDLKILTWVKGTGGARKRGTSRYTLHLQAMKNLVKEQGVFDPTGKIIRVESPEGSRVESPEGSGLVVQSSPLKVLAKSVESPQGSTVESPQGSVTTSNEPPTKTNPQKEGVPSVSVGSFFDLPEGAVVEEV